WLVPDWRGPLALLVDVVLALAMAIVVSDLLGAVGRFRRLPVVVAFVVVGLTTAAVVPRSRRPASPSRGETRASPAQLAVVGLVVAVVVGQWVDVLLPSLRHGVLETDSLRYHLTFAARFVQRGSLLHLH